MTITSKQAKELRKRIAKLVKAEVADSWKGGGNPADKPIIEEDLRIANKRLREYIVTLQLPDGRVEP